MNKLLLLVFLAVISSYLTYAQEQVPAVEWIEPYGGGTRGGSIVTFAGPNVLFALVKSQNTNSGSANLSKFTADGRVNDKFLLNDGGSSGAPFINQYASQDGGVLIYLYNYGYLRKYDANLNLSWERAFNFNIQNATATLSNGFYVLTLTYSSGPTLAEIKRLKSDGSIEWSVSLSAFSNNITDIQTTSDDGVIVTSPVGIRKYSSTGQLVWSNSSVLDGYQLVTVDASRIYLLTSNSSVRRVVQLNTSTGSTVWAVNFNTETIVDFEKTSDNGCVLSTNTGLYKFTASGSQQWKNTSFSTAKITTTIDEKIFVLKNNAITKLTLNNEFRWTKTFNSDYYLVQDVNGASDMGLYVSAMKTTSSNIPYFVLLKLASSDTPCKTSFDIIGNEATYCKIGNAAFSARLGNVPMEYMTYLTSFDFQWNRNGSPVPGATSYAYTATQTGNYSLTVRQQGCEGTTRGIQINVENDTPPVIEPEKNQICRGTPVTLNARGCDGGTVVWSTGARGNQIQVSPQATTAYNAFCEKVVNNELCQSFTSSNVTITVLSSSNLKINELLGKKEFCENSSTELTPSVSGGALPFTYIWTKNSANVSFNPTLLVNQEGEYALRIVDNIGCSYETGAVRISKVANPANPVVNAPANTTICEGGSVILTTDTKESGYQWVLNNANINGAVSQFYTATAPGNYQLKVINANGCASISSNTIFVNSSTLKINSIGGNLNFCENTSTRLVPELSGGVSPYTYQWTKNNANLAQNASIDVTQEGTYVLAVSDNLGCVVRSGNLIVKQLASPAAPVISASSGTEICVNGSVILTTTNKENAYQWLLNNTAINGATNQFYTATASGSYQLKVSNADGCSTISTNAITVTQIIIPQPVISQMNDTLISSASLGNRWFLNGNDLQLNTQKIKFTDIGNYEVKVIDRGCESAVSAVFRPTVLANEAPQVGISIYPNPTTDKVTVESARVFGYQLLNAKGQLLGQSGSGQYQHIIDLSHLSAGSYLLLIQEATGQHFARKIIVNR